MRPSDESTPAPANAGRKQDGRFRKGQSGNPRGKLPGTRNRVSVALDSLLGDEAEAILRAAIIKAKKGDPTALRLCLDRVAPVRRDRCVSFEFPPIASAADAAKATAAIVAGVAAGTLTPSEASELGKLIDSHVRALAASDFDARLKRLEEGAER